MKPTSPGTSMMADAWKTISDWHEQILYGILRAMLFFGAFALAITVFDIITIPLDKQPLPPLLHAAFYIIPYGFVAVAFFSRKPGYTIRASAPFLLLYSRGALEFYLYGLEGDGKLFFLASIVLVTLLFGLRPGIIISAVSLLILMTILLVLSMGWTVFPFQLAGGVSDPSSWLYEIVILFFLVAIVIVPMSLFIRNQEAMLKMAVEKSHLIEKTLSRSKKQAQDLALKSSRLERTERNLRTLVEELETPLVDLSDGLLLAPIVGTMDSERAGLITSRLLEQVHMRHTRQIILDITGVTAVDTQVAQALLRMVQSLHLLGCRVVITGISATVATMIANLGVDFDNIVTASSPQDVLATYQSKTPA